MDQLLLLAVVNKLLVIIFPQLVPCLEQLDLLVIFFLLFLGQLVNHLLEFFLGLGELGPLLVELIHSLFYLIQFLFQLRYSFIGLVFLGLSLGVLLGYFVLLLDVLHGVLEEVDSLLVFSLVGEAAAGDEVSLGLFDSFRDKLLSVVICVDSLSAFVELGLEDIGFLLDLVDILLLLVDLGIEIFLFLEQALEFGLVLGRHVVTFLELLIFLADKLVEFILLVIDALLQLINLLS